MGRKEQKKGGYLTERKFLEIMENDSSHLHFVGVGGVSMYSLARLSLSRGVRVSGSDRTKSDRTEKLTALGADIFLKHSADNLSGSDLVIYSHAVGQDNPEIQAAVESGIPTISRAEFMGLIMRAYKNRIGISGSHGKSTVTAMLECIFTYAGLDPTVLSGSELPSGEPFRLGNDEYLLYEACEYKDSFLHFSPTVTVGLNLELDHTDYFPDISSLKKSFTKALGRATNFSLICIDDENLSSILPKIKSRTITFGADERADYRYRITAFRQRGYEFTLTRQGSVISDFEVNIPGVFNVANATCAIAIALELGIDAQTLKHAVSTFGGIARRLEFVGTRQGRAVYYDYAHHPTEIRASITALKELYPRPLTVVFKPHTFSRTKALWHQLRESLSLADYLILTDIFPAREEKIEGVSSELLALEINGAIYAGDDDVLLSLDRHTQGTVVLMGAGDLEKIKKDVLNKKR